MPPAGPKLQPADQKFESTRFSQDQGETKPNVGIAMSTFSWLVRNRRLSKNYERSARTSETLIEVAMIRLLLRRLARGA